MTSMGTPEVVKPHSIWVLEHRLSPGMSPCFRDVATRVATQNLMIDVLSNLLQGLPRLDSLDLKPCCQAHLVQKRKVPAPKGEDLNQIGKRLT